MGILSGKRPNGPMDEITAKVRDRELARERMASKPARSRPKRNSFASKMAHFHELTRHEAYGEAMRVWYGMVDESPGELASWLDANPGFTPKYGVHIGPAGSEPWRPVINCGSCGRDHRYGAKCPEMPGNYL
jgi:hypothetical protein